MKLLGQFVGSPGTPTIKEDKPTYREHFVPPEMSMISYFLNKVRKHMVFFPFKFCHIYFIIYVFITHVCIYFSLIWLPKYKM